MKALQRLSSPALRSIQKLTQKKYRRETGTFLIEGLHLVGEALLSGAPVEKILVTEHASAKPECGTLLSKAWSMNIPLFVIPQKEMDRLTDAETSQGILGVASALRPDLADFWVQRGTSSLLVALEHVSDPGNVGTILRSCGWFGVDALFLSKGCVELHNPKTVRSTMGALFHLPVFEELDLLATLADAKDRGYRVIATALSGGVPFSLSAVQGKTLILFGSESSGLTLSALERADAIVTIPRFGAGESLNVGAACAAILGRVKLG